MFPTMRRFKQEMSENEVIKILEQEKTGILSVNGENGYPYPVPMNYVYDKGAIYFHGAFDGYKMDSINKDEKVSFCVVGEDTIIPEKFTTYYSSVVVFGRAILVEEEEQKTKIMQALNKKYSPGYEIKGDMDIAKAMKRLAVIELKIEHMTGKASMEIINEMK
ncbi:MAG: pyridoxamine 5'-phosphate oxidase family protein [Lachnospiraceae bacterium]